LQERPKHRSRRRLALLPKIRSLQPRRLGAGALAVMVLTLRSALRLRLELP
jgi:hypothetical protein